MTSWENWSAASAWGPTVAKRAAPKPPRPSGPLVGCHRCRRIGAIEVQLRRDGRPPETYAVRCTCQASAAYGGLVGIDRFTSGWQAFGATVVEWPSVKERELQGTICNISQDVPPVQEAK